MTRIAVAKLQNTNRFVNSCVRFLTIINIYELTANIV